MIRGVTFDFWQTLAEDAPENLAAQRRLRLEALHSALRWSGLEVDADQVEAGYERSQGILEERFWNRRRDPGFAEQVALVLDCVAPGAADAVRTLAAQGLRLGVISNTGRTPGMVLRRYLEREGLLRHFQVVTFSDEVGLRKPEAEIFRRTLAKLGPELGLEPHEVAHIGDNPEADVEGARAAGMRAVHYAVGGRPGAMHADLVVTDLASLAERLAAG